MEEVVRNSRQIEEEQGMKKKIIASICAIILVLATVVGTIAYFTDSDSALNTFSVGKVGITFDETDTDNDDNTQDNVTVGTVVRDKANKYHLIPGSTYEKDPTIHVDTGSEDCYLFVKVKDEIAAIEADATVANQIKAKWTEVKVENLAANEKVYVYTNGTNAPVKVTAEENIIVFSNFTVKGEVTNEQLAAYQGKQNKIDAYAIQAAGFEDFTAEQIWAKF